MFNYKKTLELPIQLEWKRSDEPELMSWTIRARNYNTFVANIVFTFLLLLTLAASTFLYWAYQDLSQFWRWTWCTLFYIVMALTISSMTHQRVNFAYRLTHSGMEHCEWKDFPSWAPPLLRWIAGVTAVIFLFMATIDPTFLIGALVGPGGMGLMSLQMAYSKNFRALHTRYHHVFMHWTELTGVTIATNRDIVEVDFSYSKPDSSYMAIGNEYIFFKKNNKQDVIRIIKSQMPANTPCRVAHVNVFR
ncbi:hypothetical protein SAMN03159444_02886 [Pseudomonas sp. NFACC02]|uniref:hypothetical protein n=1 Tax=Pseudomonas TaxID=286 RepID=UPI0007823B3D|nr:MULTISPECIES: hypothetical protein [Pseudomonas]SEQ96556.1 hypothetical protein SAMN03159444_02886 [Pseudomonas sp. NFACC02]